MKRYKDNEEARDKFVTEQRKDSVKGATKKAVLSADGNPVSGESSEDGWGSMFGPKGDLAMDRKKEAAAQKPFVTIEAVKSDVSGASVATVPVNTLSS